jgi:hypothetical protein
MAGTSPGLRRRTDRVPRWVLGEAEPRRAGATWRPGAGRRSAPRKTGEDRQDGPDGVPSGSLPRRFRLQLRLRCRFHGPGSRGGRRGESSSPGPQVVQSRVSRKRACRRRRACSRKRACRRRRACCRRRACRMRVSGSPGAADERLRGLRRGAGAKTKAGEGDRPDRHRGRTGDWPAPAGRDPRERAGGWNSRPGGIAARRDRRRDRRAGERDVPRSVPGAGPGGLRRRRRVPDGTERARLPRDGRGGTGGRGGRDRGGGRDSVSDWNVADQASPPYPTRGCRGGPSRFTVHFGPGKLRGGKAEGVVPRPRRR